MTDLCVYTCTTDDLHGCSLAWQRSVVRCIQCYSRAGPLADGVPPPALSAGGLTRQAGVTNLTTSTSLHSVANLGRFLSVKEPNIRYLALENLARLALVPEVLDAMRHHAVTITANLKVSQPTGMRATQ